MKKGYWLSLIISAVFFIFGLWTMSDYGINWDAPFRMMRGQAIIEFLLTGKEEYGRTDEVSPVLIKPGESISHYNNSASEGLKMMKGDKYLSGQMGTNNRLSYYRSDIWGSGFTLNYDPGHLPLIDELAALSNRILFEKMRLIDDIESYQLVYLLLSAAGVFLAGELAYEITKSNLAAAVSSLSLGFSPYFMAEAHINMKDPVQASFFTGAIFAMYMWVKSGGNVQIKRGLFWFGLLIMFTALALATKWNIVFFAYYCDPLAVDNSGNRRI